MRRSTNWMLVAGVVSIAAGPWACGDDESGGGAGAGASGPTGSTSSLPGTSISSTSGMPTSTTGTMPPDCAEIADFIPDCNTCLEARCCQQIADWGGGDPVAQEVLQCMGRTCGLSCSGVAVVGANECNPQPFPASSMGSCVTLDATLKIGCNPVTNEGCDTAGGIACDALLGGGFACFAPPNDKDICTDCDSGPAGPWCKPGMTCIGDAGTKCSAFCCTDTDCGPGTCYKGDAMGAVFPAAPDVGVCVGDGMGGAGGSGGIGGAGGVGGVSAGGAAGGGMGGAGGN